MTRPEDTHHDGTISLTPQQAQAVAALTIGAQRSELYGSPLSGRRVRLDVCHFSVDQTPTTYIITPEGVIRDKAMIALDASELAEARR